MILTSVEIIKSGPVLLRGQEVLASSVGKSLCVLLGLGVGRNWWGVLLKAVAVSFQLCCCGCCGPVPFLLVALPRAF